jgi:hypothetical protein
MRHREDNILKNQAPCEGVTISPRNPMECEIFFFAHAEGWLWRPLLRQKDMGLLHWRNQEFTLLPVENQPVCVSPHHAPGLPPAASAEPAHGTVYARD